MAGTRERRSKSSVTLRGCSAASEVSTRNFSDHATSGRQNSKLTPTHHDDHHHDGQSTGPSVIVRLGRRAT